VVFSPVLLSGGPWAHISAGGFHNLAITESGELFGWGKNNWFQLGELSGDFISVPTQISTTNPTGWRDVAAGMDHSLMLKDSGELYGAGRNDHGQRGSDDTPVDGLYPIDTSNTWKAIGSGSHHSIAKNTSGDIYMWGKGHFGALGTGMDLDEIVPTLTKQAP
jgi:alpha-tubulin suppressor-like RCC1 family protein